MAYKVVLLGGQFDGQSVELAVERDSAPEEIDVGGTRYRLIRDPDTREPLDGYVRVTEELL